MRIIKPIAVLAALTAAFTAHGATQTYAVTLTIGDVAGDGAAPGTNNSSGPAISQFLCANGATAPDYCFSGNFDGSGDKIWTSQGANVIVLTSATTTILEQRNLNEGNEGTTGNNGTNTYNPYDELREGPQDYSAYGQPDCTAFPLVVQHPYSCIQKVGVATKQFPTVLQGIGPAATASGVVVVDDVAGTLTGTLSYGQGPASPAGVAFDYRFGDGSPFNAARDSVSTGATLALSLTGTFTSTAWTITGGHAQFTDPALVCTPGDGSATLCNTSNVLGGHQPDGAHLTWEDTAVYDAPDQGNPPGTVQFTIPGVIGSGTVDGSGNVTANGEFHRPGGSAGGGCLSGIVYSATPVMLNGSNGPYFVNISCGSITAGIFTLTGGAAGNATPVANPDSAVTVLNVPVNIAVLGNDTALVDTPLTVTITAQGSKGVATVNGSPGLPNGISVTYTPNMGALGTDSFTYQVADKDNDVASAAVSVTINDQPVAIDDTADSFGTNPVSINVLANDTGLSGAPFTVTIATAPLHGTAQVNGSPGAAGAISITYTSTDNMATADSFQYTVTDVNGGFATGTVDVTRTADVAPMAVDDSANTTVGVAVTVSVLANDTPGNGANVVSIETAPTAAEGTASVNSATNEILFTPAVGFYGTASFSYRLTDNDGQFATAQVTVTVVAPMPVAAADSANTNENATSAPIDVIANDTLGVGTPAEHVVSISLQANVGSCTVNADNTITYAPPPGFFGMDVCTYRLTDSVGQTSTAVLTIAVAKVVSSGSSLDVGSLLAFSALGVPVMLRRRRSDRRA